MKNYEKYADKIKNYGYDSFCDDFIQPYILKQNGCGSMDCEQCNMIQMIWLMKEYEEPKVDWSKVKVDTPILVSESEDGDWYRRYFAKYKNGKVFAWSDGRSSWNETDVRAWNYAKLAESERKDNINESKTNNRR